MKLRFKSLKSEYKKRNNAVLTIDIQTNPLIKQMIGEFMNTRAKYTVFLGSPFAALTPLLSVAKAINLYISYTAVYIYLMAISINEACRGMNRGGLKALLSSLGPLCMVPVYYTRDY